MQLDSLKLAAAGRMHGKDINGRGVQYALLKLMEETEIDLNSGHDMLSQMQTFMEFQREGSIKKRVVNTKNILFIVSGAFSGIEEIVKRRLKTSTIGINNQYSSKHHHDYFFQQTTTRDFIDFGFEPEFIARLPIRVCCTELSANDLLSILKNSKDSILKQYATSFAAFGITLTFTDKALALIAELAAKEKTGARALMTVLERVLRPYKFELPSTNIKSLTLTVPMVNDPEKHLSNLLKRSHSTQRASGKSKGTNL